MVDNTSTDTGALALSLVQRERDAQTVTLLTQAGALTDHAAARTLRDEAVELNLTLASSMARGYVNRGVDLQDLQQVALLGLVLAVDRFDPELGRPFAPYARVTIHGELKRHLRDYAWAVRPPRGLHDLYLEINNVTQDLIAALGHPPSVEQIATSMGLEPAQVREAQMASSSYAANSLQALAEERGDGFTGAGLNMGAVPSLEARLTSLDLAQIVQALPDRDRLIVQLRFVQDLTQRQIGQHLGISQMQVSRLLTAIMARLKTALSAALPEAS